MAEQPAGLRGLSGAATNGEAVELYATLVAAFLGTWDGRTLFAGLYAASEPVLVDEPIEVPLTGTIASPGTVDRFTTTLSDHLADFVGRLYIDWGGGSSGKRSWNQRADVQDKQITELHLDQTERPFPGLMALTSPLSVISEAPQGWVQRLADARGVYLLACPRTGELYVGSATGAGGSGRDGKSIAATVMAATSG